MNAIEKHLYEKGRRDGLEEAAKVVELDWTVNSLNDPNWLKGIAQAIRALKEKQ